MDATVASNEPLSKGSSSARATWALLPGGRCPRASSTIARELSIPTT
jgi:hypothetical protein